MAGFAVLAEALAMIAHDYHDRVADAVVPVEPIQQSSYLGVHKGNLTHIGTVGIAAGPGLGWFVWRVGVVEVHPRKEASLRRFIEPRQGGVRDLIGGTFDLVEGTPRALLEIKVVEIVVKTLGDAPFRVQDKGSDETAGTKTGVPKQFRHDHSILSEVEPPVVPHSVRRRKLTGEDRGVSRQRQRCDRFSLFEEDALTSQAIQIRCLDVGKTIGADAIRTSRVQSDHQQTEVIGEGVLGLLGGALA